MIKMRKGEQPLVMMIKEVMPRVTVVVTAVAVRATTMKTMIANKVAMIGLNPPVIEKMKTQSFTMKNMKMM